MISFPKASKTHKMQMRIYCAICAMSGVSLVADYWANRGAFNHGKNDLYIVWYAIAFLTLAAGLLAASVWAELILDLCLVCLSVGILASLVENHETDGSQIFLDFFLSALLMTPVALSIQQLKQGAYFRRAA
jgi:hypothetical protein